ncbi:MAG: uncharacterized protein JWP33_2867 [Blastococcus sp.]|jgi:hypothetical protein|nr:uncharacterized protein [Blastococcus sp.]
MDRMCQVRDIGEARVPVVSEAEMAEHLRSRGRRVVAHRGRSWYQVLPGFYRPVHVLARLSAAEATRPTAACWGFQACLDDDDAGRANAAIPTHLISDLDSFDEASLPKTRRHTLRKARERARFVELTGPALLRAQGYDVVLSARERTGYGSVPTPQAYQAALDRFGDPAEGIVLAGIVDGRLAGYLTGRAVDGTAYAMTSVVATWALRANVSTGLHYEFINACRRAGVREIVDGLHARENEGLCRSKELNGVPLVRVPARLTMLPGAAAVLRRRDRHKYYRMSGR